MRGALPAQTITQLIQQNCIQGALMEHVSPASLDLTLSEEMYLIRGLILPQVGETIRDLLSLMEAQPADIKSPVACGQLYLVRLNETLDLPQHIYGHCNPKSSTGRLDMHVRVLADGVPRYDSVTPKGFTGELWVAIASQSFSVQLHVGTPLTQLRLFTGDSRFSESDLELALKDGLVWHPKEDRPLTYNELVTNDKDGAVVLTALVEEGVCGYQCIAEPEQILDVQNISHYLASDFFQPMHPDNGVLRLKRDQFYILSAALLCHSCTEIFHKLKAENQGCLSDAA
jgi:dCTP deaminase